LISTGLFFCWLLKSWGAHVTSIRVNTAASWLKVTLSDVSIAQPR
jgi:hypothetical protein